MLDFIFYAGLGLLIIFGYAELRWRQELRRTQRAIEVAIRRYDEADNR